ncbi:MAG TPA: GH25 family lysozyme [Actinomycetota bacterium]|nr:GH25 family lysozyme [Actinomycetota bacterium]
MVRPSVRTIRRRALAVGTLTLATLAPTAIAVRAGAAPAVTRVPGIDVSKWQGDVDWAEVATTTTRYVVMRATIGNTATVPRSIDSRYLGYLAEATANGLVVGAYRRANVGRATNDAVNEADHFVDTAQVAAGDILPVLDIEQTHGLNVEEMQDWVRAWVQRVRARTGVLPMMYSSPYFWRTNMGDAT